MSNWIQCLFFLCPILYLTWSTILTALQPFVFTQDYLILHSRYRDCFTALQRFFTYYTLSYTTFKVPQPYSTFLPTPHYLILHLKSHSPTALFTYSALSYTTLKVHFLVSQPYSLLYLVNTILFYPQYELPSVTVSQPYSPFCCKLWNDWILSSTSHSPTAFSYTMMGRAIK